MESTACLGCWKDLYPATEYERVRNSKHIYNQMVSRWIVVCRHCSSFNGVSKQLPNFLLHWLYTAMQRAETQKQHCLKGPWLAVVLLATLISHWRYLWYMHRQSKVLKFCFFLNGRYYVKSAQVMASKGDFLPVAWVQQMTPIFFDSMKPRDWVNVESVCS